MMDNITQNDGWIWDKRACVWLWGDANNGCGVYYEAHHGYYANIVINNVVEYSLGPLDCSDETKKAAMKQFKKRISSVG